MTLDERGPDGRTSVDGSLRSLHHAEAMTHTCVSWLMCMTWRPRRAEDGV
jgi:hypothetical protein